MFFFFFTFMCGLSALQYSLLAQSLELSEKVISYEK